MTPAIGSFCTGYGGLDKAVQAVFGGELVWWSDIEPGPIAVMERHCPGSINVGDIKTAAPLYAVLPKVDILTAGYPCQPFSNAGLRRGTEDPRHLWPYIADAVGALRPGLVVLENVAAHLRRGFDVVLQDLASLGYDATWTVVRASDVGAPHRRERLFVLAADSTRERGAGGWDVRTDGRPEHPDGSAAVTDASGARLEVGRVEQDGGQRSAAQRDRGESATDAVSQPVRVESGRVSGSDGSGAAEPGHSGALAGEYDCPGCGDSLGEHHYPGQSCPAADAASDGRNERLPEPTGQLGRPDVAERGASAIANTLRERLAGHPQLNGEPLTGQDGERGHDLDGRAGADFGPYQAAIERWAGVLGRPAPDPTTTGQRGARVLSPQFVEWMMGLPAGHVTDTEGLSRNQQLKLLGNGVVPQQAEHALRQLLATVASIEAAAA